MDIQTLGAAIAMAKSIPGSAGQRAETAAGQAEAAAVVAAEAAVLAEQHSYGVSVVGTGLIFSKEDND